MNDLRDVLAVPPVRAAAGWTGQAKTRRESLYRSTKTYGHNEGLSCCFRQWRATHSHCRLLHGYALSFEFIFTSADLDERNWCFDFGGLKPVRAWLHHMFDHTTLVAEDDPSLPVFQDLADSGLIDLRILHSVGCESTARQVFDFAGRFVAERSSGRVWLESVEVREHAGNSALYSEARS